MTKTLKLIPRHQLDATAWDACVANSRQRILYGYSWYLDAVLPAPSWKWVGLILTDEAGHYLAVMPIPLRRKRIVGTNYSWVVHQPFFCQFLAVFSPDETIDFTPFLRLIQQKFRYGSTFCLRQQPDESRSFSSIRMASTQCLDLSVGYNAIYENYTRDRKQNLKRAVSANWTVVDSTDPVPLLVLFQENHEAGIEGGVAVWAYNSLQNLVTELSERNLITLRYACQNGHIEAGALFVREGNRIIYLFNSASEAGRRGNARTLLIDQVIREHAGNSLIFDFESPEKPSIREFYQSFGASEEPFYEVRWNRLSRLENLLRLTRRFIKH